MPHLFTLPLIRDQDVVTARQRVAEIAALLGLDVSEQTRIATAVSEIVRNAFRYAGGGVVVISLDAEAAPQRLVVHVRDSGRGIAELDAVLAGRFVSRTGMGIGIAGARRLLDGFAIETSPAGTSVRLEKHMPARADFITPARAREIAEAIAQRQPRDLVEEVQQQNQQLLRALDDLHRKQEELTRLNRELEDTNRGVLALYAELDDKADHLRRADELKSRFLSNMTHEFRTPVNSIVGLCNLLEEGRRTDNQPLEPEITYIRKAADTLSDLVNDLLDLAKVEAGKSPVRVSEFDARQLFGALRGMLRPLLLDQSVALIVEDPEGLPLLSTDEAKVSQILRNLVSNALKFTERGEVRVRAEMGSGDLVVFIVSDTGIGIAAADLHRIFDEFTQLEHRLHSTVRGTGLGLPLSRRLAELLGGSLTVHSEPGLGSTFTLALPAHYRSIAPAPAPFTWTPDPARRPVLVVDDADDAQFFYEKALTGSPFQPVPARTIGEAQEALRHFTPAAIVLDLVLGDEDGWDLLDQWRVSGELPVPVVVASALDERQRAHANGVKVCLVKPVDRRTLIETLSAIATAQAPLTRVLAVDDEEVSRFLIRQCLPAASFDVREAESAEAGLAFARTERPDIILLDLILGGMDGRTALETLAADPLTSSIPVVIVTAVALEPPDRQRLLEHAAAIMSKAQLSRETLGDLIRSIVVGGGRLATH